MSVRLRVDPIACDGHGLCAELVPELVRLDEWGYPILSAQPVPERLAKHVKRAIAACPVLALRLEPAAAPPPAAAAVPERDRERSIRVRTASGEELPLRRPQARRR